MPSQDSRAKSFCSFVDIFRFSITRTLSSRLCRVECSKRWDRAAQAEKEKYLGDLFELKIIQTREANLFLIAL